MSRHPRLIPVLCLALAAGSWGGCTPPPDELDPLVGSWTSTMLVAGERNELELDASLAGEATIYFFYDGSPYYAELEVLAERRGDGLYELAFECIGDCSAFDFDAWCELAGSRLDCEGDGLWADYELEWERD